VTASNAESIVDVLTSDHRAIKDLIDAAEAESADSSADLSQEAERERLVMDLVRHFVAEEQYLYPMVRERLDNGAEIADRGFHSHRECEHVLRRLERTSATRDDIVGTLRIVRDQFAQHVQDQEGTIFPDLAAMLSVEELNELGSEALGAEQLAPTRPRAVASESAAVNKVSSFFEGFIDHVRDSYSHRGVDAADRPND
jgi:hemerythrin-like domain-containing protein